MKSTLLTFALIVSFNLAGQPTVSFTFDDGATNERSGYAFKDWNQMLLDHLNEANITSALFITGFNKLSEDGRYLLDGWDDAGHMIANHTFTHPNFNSDENNLAEFIEEFVGTDTLISKYKNYSKLFRFPYLKEGNTPEEVKGIRDYLESVGYHNGYVTIDASDWYVESRLRARLKEDPNADLQPYRNFYLEHIYERSLFYEELAYKLTGRHIKHTLLLHHNLVSALFLGDLIDMFQSKGWGIVSAEEAFQDPIFQQTPQYAGESLIWALAKDSGKFEELLRYPAEDSRYEKDRMDELGL